MSLGIWQILIVAALVVLLFGRGRISEMMGDIGKGITSFRKGLKEPSDDDAASRAKTIDNETGEPVDAASDKKR